MLMKITPTKKAAGAIAWQDRFGIPVEQNAGPPFEGEE
jgi:hypothetical protein